MSDSATPYDATFYELQKEQSHRSAKVVAPIVKELIDPQSVVDLGSGIGTWLKAFLDLGVEDVLGLDGDYVDRAQFMIPEEKFRPTDLAQPVKLERSFDLAMSLEVAEHLPEACADGFVESLAGLAPVVLFSAAIPLQGGDEHVNEQWQDYWVEKFVQRGFVAIDCIRPRIWQNPDVDIWYAQNTILFVKHEALERYPRVKAELEKTDLDRLSVVHPEALSILARNYAKKTVTLSKLVRWRLRGVGDENYRLDKTINKGMRYRRGESAPPAQPE